MSSPATIRLALALTVAAPTAPLLAQQDTVLLRRWVGTRPAGGPFYIEFYGDTMLVVDDTYALDFRLSRDSIVATGDTTLAFRFRISHGRLLLETPEGRILTMAPQSALARPITGRWTGTLATEMADQIELQLFRGGSARWRRTPGGIWQAGEWERNTRTLTLLWLPDSLEWGGQYDPIGNALLFGETEQGSGPVIFRRLFR